MTIEFRRGAFENPDDPSHGDDVDTSIVVVTASDHVDAARGAVERCRERWRGIDGAGRYHPPDDAAFWTAQADNHGPEWHTAKHISDLVVDADGVAVDVDCQGLMPAAMRDAYRDVLIEELAAAGIDDAMVRSADESDHEPVEKPPAGRWPPYAGSEVAGLPPGVPPGRVFHRSGLRRHGAFRNWFLQRDFDDVWEAGAAAMVDVDEEEAVGEACRLFGAAGWAVGEPQAYADWDGKPLTAVAMACPGAVALVTCQAAAYARGQGLAIPKAAERVIIAVAYYDLVPPGPEGAGDGA